MEESPQYFYSSPTSPGAPTEFTPRQAMASFENLVALANYQERLKGARKIVWRDRGQPVVELPTLKDCLEHAATGALRSATLAFNIRASLNLVLALIRIHKVPRDDRLKLIRNAIFGTDSLRFAAMLGTFAAVYKFLINALPILIPAINPRPRNLSSPFYDDDDDDEEMELPRTVSYPPSGPATPLHRRREARLSLSAHAQMVLVRKRTRRWHSALAGAIAGSLAILWEKRGRRAVIAQQMFVRGLQGTYNSYSDKYGIHVPYGAVMVFAVACGQIMYAYTMRPDTLPRSYINWIQGASHLSDESVRINHIGVREHRLDLPALDAIMARPGATPTNAALMEKLRASALAGGPVPHYGPCEVLHPKLTSCWSVPLDRFVDVFKLMLPIYSALHFLPPILLRWRQFRADPGRLLVRSGLGSVRSSAFLGVFVIIYQGANCLKHQTYERIMESPFWRKVLPQRLVDLLISKGSFWPLGFLAGLALLLEEERRRAELAMYVLPKGLESAWVAARGRGLVFRTGNWGESALTGLAMGMVMSTYQNDPEHLSGLVRRILYQFIGPN
ncbi:WD-REPEATS-REGION domain-containing protein [Mycena venus]|uniref:WD-REPEATS-REGION domain-containing protein n=1 Tax=Mycena venus TaxID=2733690 RepID=A0A8H6YMG8_9AGAR|nr:WD-REPEATS-REGION domain-containing protein [Mycena venus]